MLKVIAVVAILWGMLVSYLPWLITVDRNHAVDMIIFGCGLALIASGVAMWRKAGSETR